jgi:lipoprotein-anchoring transpeptidase ErfK/SrfK
LAADRPERAVPQPALLVSIPRTLPITARSNGGPRIGWMPAGSRYYGIPLTAWVLEVSKDGRHGRVTVPYSGTNRTGWISLKGLARHRTPFTVTVDLSRRQVTVTKLGRVVYRTSGAIGTTVSPTPPGRYFVTDRVPFSRGSSLGTFAFGISGIQTHLPPGWNGGDQLAIHGTNAPWTIGTRASAGCVRVSETALAKLKAWLLLGTPVVIQA